MKKTKAYALLLAGLLLISLAGCKNTEQTAEKESDTLTQTIQTADVILDTEPNDDITAEEPEPPAVEPETPVTSETTPAQTAEEKTPVAPPPVQSEQPQQAYPPKQTETPKPTEPPKQTETTTPSEAPTESTKPAAPSETEEPKPIEQPKAATADDCKAIADKIIQYINSYRSVSATKLPGLTQYAEYRSRQIISNFAHDTDDQRAAATALQYGEYVDPPLYGMTGDPYYTANAKEAIAKAGYRGTADYVAEQLALQFKNSASHWSYISDTKYQYIAVGVTCQNGTWYCAVALTQTNTDNN